MMRLRGFFSSVRVLKGDTNQALQLGKYAISFLETGNPSPKVLQKVKMFHTDSVLCGLSALALSTNAPLVLRSEALEHSSTKIDGIERASVFGSSEKVLIEKAIVANCSAVREWDSNGTVFGYDKDKERQAGEFGHNDFYPVVIAAAHVSRRVTGKLALKAMVLQDEIRGRLCEVFSLKSYKIDHVVHGAIASICVYGALIDASPEHIESAIGMFVAHYIPWRAIRAGKQLSDSKGASAAISTQAAIMCIKRSIRGFVGPKDIFRNPQAIFRYFQKTSGNSPFDISLSTEGDDFAVMGMHFKLGLYQHQSAGALEGIQKIFHETDFLNKYSISDVKNIHIIAYEPAFGIIGDPAKRTPQTRQSADHSMVYIVSTMLRKALADAKNIKRAINLDEVWKSLMLTPIDYGYNALFNKQTRQLMTKCTFEHGGKEYDAKYPQGIPTKISITTNDEKVFASDMIMFPSGHSRNTTANLKDILKHKNKVLGSLALEEKELDLMLHNLNDIANLSNKQLQQLYQCNIRFSKHSVDSPKYTKLN